ITMGTQAYAGLAVMSFNSAVNTTVTFDHVAITNSSGTNLPDFTLSATSASSHTVNAGGTVSFALKATSVAGYSQPISFTVTGLPSGATPSFNPPQVSGTGTSTLTVATDASTPGGSYPLTVTAVSGKLSHSL